MGKKKLGFKNVAASEGYENLSIESLLTFKSEPAKSTKFSIKDKKEGGYYKVIDGVKYDNELLQICKKDMNTSLMLARLI